jgi:hypothetical protein
MIANQGRLHMRKFILIAAMFLASATAQASGMRSLTLASNDEPAAVAQPKAAETPQTSEAPKYVDRPAAVDTSAPKTDQAKSVADKDIQTPKVAKPKHRHESTEARVIYELHRHGIYW